MSKQIEKESIELQISRVKGFIEEIERVVPLIKKLTSGSTELDAILKDALMSYAVKINFASVNPDSMKEWENHPYVLYQEKGMREYEWKIAVPKWADSVHFGMLVGEIPGHRVFLVSRYIDMVYDLPDWLRDKIGAKKDPLDIKLDLSTMQLVGKDVGKVKDKYSKFMKKEDGVFKVDKEQYFELLAQMIEDGIKPFEPKPIPEELLVKRPCSIILRDYQKEAFDKIKKSSQAFIVWPPSAGKTYVTIYLHSETPGPHLVTVPQRTLQEQWAEREELYCENIRVNTGTDVKAMQESDVTILTYQAAIKHAHKIKWTSVTVDEGHHLPANEFSKMAGIERQITLGLSATPHREDGRERYLYALFGEGISIDWESMKKIGIIKSPDLHVWIVKNEKDRMSKLDDLLQDNKHTMIFSDEIELGKTISKKYNIPFVYGDSKDRMNTIRSSRQFVISRVGDEGISLPDIERVIEVSFLKGSRRQELQRFTRLLHSKSQTVGDGHIIFDPEEYTLYHKRLFGVMDRGFKIIIHRDGISDKVINTSRPEGSPRPRAKTPSQKPSGLNSVQKPKSQIELDDPFLKLPGVQKLLKECSKSELDLLQILYKEKDKPFAAKAIGMLLGVEPRGVINFSKLLKMGLIKKVGKKYQADPTLGGAMA